MKRLSALILATLALSVATPALAQRRPAAPPTTDSDPKVESTEELNLAVGENKTIKAGDVKNYSEGTPGIADVKLTTDGSQFVIVGSKPGTTTLLLIKKDGTTINWMINVFARPPSSVERELGQLLEGITGVRVRRVGARFFIDGGVNTEAEAKRIGQIAALFPGQVESLVSVGSGSAERKVNIRVDFFFVQYDRTSSYQVGMSWPTQIGGAAIQSELAYDFLAGTVTSAQASIVNQPLPGLDIASRNGWAKVMKQSTVITTNGSEALFESGGEQNFTITSAMATGIQKISFGTNITVLPRFDPRTGDLEIKLGADVSDLTPPASSSILPGRNTSRLATIVHLKLGQSVVLSGIRTQSERRSTTGLPLLSDIPLLGILFGSHFDAKQDVEGAVFVIPSVVDTVPKNALDMINSAMSQYEEYTGDIESINAYNKRPSLQPADVTPTPTTPAER